MSVLSQLWLLLKKNFLLRKRQPVTLFVEFLWPILLLLIVAFIKRASPPAFKGPCYYQPLELPNGDFLSFMKSFVCMLDYKCHSSSRIKDSVPFQNHLDPLYDIVVSGDTSYQQVSVLLEGLKNALYDVNDIRNEPIIQKFNNGSISLNDFLNDTTSIRNELKLYGVGNQISNTLLASQIKIIEIYKVLDVSSKFKEKYLCNPLETYQYFKADGYFFNSSKSSDSPKMSQMIDDNFKYVINQEFPMLAPSGKEQAFSFDQKLTTIVGGLTAQEQANYNLADIICRIPKKQLITDADFLAKEIQTSSLSNYTDTIVNYFSGSNFQQTIVRLTRYFAAGEKFKADLSLIQSFSSIDEITGVTQDGLKLLSLVRTYEEQFKFTKQLLIEFSPLFDTIQEYNDIKMIIDFVIALNKLMDEMNSIFTMENFFGAALVDFYERNLLSDTYSQRYELLQLKISFEKALQFLFKVKFGNAREAVCDSPRITGVYNDNIPPYIKANLDYKLERYCQINANVPADLSKKVLASLNFDKIIEIMNIGISPLVLGEFSNAAAKLTTYSFAEFNIGSTNDLVAGFKTVNAALTFLQDSLVDTTKLNLRNFYTLGKSLIKIFLPDFLDDSQWLYADIFLPIFLPTLDINNGFQPVVARGLTFDTDDQEISDEQIEQLSSLTNGTQNATELIKVVKRAIQELTTQSSNVESTSAYDYYQYDMTDTNGTSNVGRAAVTPAVSFEDKYPALANLFGGGNGLQGGLASLLNPQFVKQTTAINTLLQADASTTLSASTIRAGLGQIGSAAASGTSIDINPVSLLDLINSINTGNVVGSTTGLLSLVTPLLALLPFDTIFPDNTHEQNLALVASVPEILKLIEFFNSFQLLSVENQDPLYQLAQWKQFIIDLKEQAMHLLRILLNVGIITNNDMAIIQTVLATNLETISDPEVIGKVVLGCQGLNIAGVIQPKDSELRKAMSSLQLIFDIGDLVLNTTLRLVEPDVDVFKCSDNPLDDYYRLTKNLNILAFADKIKSLILERPTEESQAPIPTLNCLKIDSIYRQALRVETAMKNDVNGVIGKKLDCFRTSIMIPTGDVLEQFRNIFTSVEENADTVTLLSSGMNKFVDLIKLFGWFGNFFQATDGKPSLISDTGAVKDLLDRLPELSDDLAKFGLSLQGLDKMQANLDVSDLDKLKTGDNMFELLDTLKTYEPVITVANVAVREFWEKYFDLITRSSYSSIFFDIHKGVEALDALVQFVIKNINGIKIKQIFGDYGKISRYLQDQYQLSEEDADAVGESFMFTNPQGLYDFYSQSKDVYCDAKKLKYFMKVENSAYVQVADEGIPNFWEAISGFLCGANTTAFSSLMETLGTSFALPSGVKDIFENDNSIFSKLNSNSSVFTNLNTSTIEVIDANSMEKLDTMFKLFAGINSEYSGYSLPNVLGKSLCGADFLLDLGNYGYSLETPAKPVLPMSELNNTARLTRGEKIDKAKPDCPALFNEIRKIGGSVIGNLITPLLFGKILYTPKNNVTDKVIQKFNETFRQFDRLNQVLDSFSNGIDQFEDLKQLTANLSILLDNPFYQDFIQLFLLQDSNLKFSDVRFFLETLQNVTSLSNNWSYISNMLTSLKNAVSCFETDRFIALDNEKDLERMATQLFNNATFLIGFVFENTKPTDTVLPPNFNVKLRMNLNNVPETNLPRGWLWIPGPADNLFMDLRYMRGFIQVQNLLERAIINQINEDKNVLIPNEMMVNSGYKVYGDKEFPVVYLQQFPYPKYRSEDVTSSYINYFILPIIVTLMWSGNIGLAIRNLIKEKEKFIEETMKAMGLRPGINWLAWFLSTYFNMLIISLLVSLILKYGTIFPMTNLGIIFLSLAAFAFSAIMLAYFVGSFFTKTNLASLIGILAYFMSYLPFILVMSIKYELTFENKFGLCLSSATAFGYSSLYMSWYEQQGKGLQFKDIWVSPIPNDKMTYGLTIVLMFMDGLVYGLLGWYVQNVFPSRYGASKPFYFLVTPKFWKTTFIGRMFCRTVTKPNEYAEAGPGNYKKQSKKGAKQNNKDRYIEQEPQHLPQGISIRDMSRKFKERTVVNNLSLNFFEGQITALLGHNGAGKSTTINVLTGIYVPSSGTAFINGKDVRYEYNQIKKSVGICPQHDILFDYMTVKEHLVFYGKLKANMGGKELKRDIANMMTKVGLTQYSNDYVSALSGGLRRRLEVAIAFVSGSKTVILDEPTSGVDPYNRMKIWDIILELRQGRTILLTTHYLEEADVLSDRIAIIHQGRLQCCGSSLFLKNKFGSGYILTIDKKLTTNPSNQPQTKKEIAEMRAKSSENISNFIGKRIQDATLTRHINNTLNYTLPYEHKSDFESFFHALEKNKSALDISSYGISDTTLEEIFLMLTTRDENGDLVTPMTAAATAKNGESAISMTPNLSTSFDSDKDSGVAVELGSPDVSNKSANLSKPSYLKRIFGPSYQLNSSMTEDSISEKDKQFEKPQRYTKRKGRGLYLQQFLALIAKRFHHNRRNLRVLFTNIMLPILFVALSMGFTTIRPKLREQASLELTPQMYAPNKYFVTFDQTNNSFLDAASQSYSQSFQEVCKNNLPPPGYSATAFSQENLNGYLCNLVQPDKCSLIYQFEYESMASQQNIQDSLQIAPATVNCSIEAYLIDTHQANIDDRFGGITYADSLIKTDMYGNQSKVIVWFENQAYHSMPSFLHEFYTQHLQCSQTYDSATGDCQMIGNQKQPLYRIYNHPISLSDERISMDSIVQKVSDIGISLTILCAFSFIPAGFVVYIVRERITQEKRLQYVCGVKPFLYWFASFVWDMVYFFVIILITLAVISMFGETAYTSNMRNFTALSLLLLLFGWSSLPLSYMLSRFFKDTGSAYMIVFCFTLFSGIATCVSVFLLSFIADTKKSLKMLYEFLSIFSMIFPSYSLGSGLIEITKNQILSDTYAIFGVNVNYQDPFAMDILGQKYVALFVTGIIFFLILALMETKINFFPCCKPSMIPSNEDKVEDIDVSRERERIQKNEARSDVLVAKNLTKRYRKATGSKVCAVNNVCFSIPWGHCFGLLGINGAGKTTTFKMITDEIQPTFGSRLFNNMKLKEFLHDNIVGYCPQFDAVDEFLTGKEALFIYSKLIGLNEANAAINSAILRFKLQSFVDVPIIKYSGGMKRTLSVAVAMLGDPQVVLLDEPTNGMDPEMRRRVWDNILSLIKEDRSVLLTSHSMAECDVLCSRLAIMVNGQFTCLGTTQHLKHRFGGGYTLQIKVSKDTAINSVCEFIESKFVNCILKDKHGMKLEYIIPHRGNSLGKIFGVMEINKLNYFISDYSVSQTTLDQVFINFASQQRGDNDTDSEYDDDEEEYQGSEFDETELDKKPDQVPPEVRVSIPGEEKDVNVKDPSAFESIKDHFNSLKKSRHIRKTSSAKSVNRNQSLRSRKSSRRATNKSGHRPSISDGGFTNLAYEVEYRNSVAYDSPIQENGSSMNYSLNEADEFSRC